MFKRVLLVLLIIYIVLLCSIVNTDIIEIDSFINNNKYSKIEEPVDILSKSGQSIYHYKNTIYLTFDDGPTTNLYNILSILDKYNAKVTFFFVASRLPFYKQHVKAVIRRGHTIASHGFSHIPTDIYGSIDSFKNDFFLWQTIFKKEIGYVPNIFRFPYGSNSKYIYKKNDIKCLSKLAIRYLKDNNICYVDWDVSSSDGNSNTSNSQIYDIVINNMDDIKNPIILLHEWNEKTISVLEDILIYGRNKGYIFKALDNNVSMPRFVE